MESVCTRPPHLLLGSSMCQPALVPVAVQSEVGMKAASVLRALAGPALLSGKPQPLSTLESGLQCSSIFWSVSTPESRFYDPYLPVRKDVFCARHHLLVVHQRQGQGGPGEGPGPTHSSHCLLQNLYGNILSY